jgi:hypothetical protein
MTSLLVPGALRRLVSDVTVTGLAEAAVDSAVNIAVITARRARDVATSLG